jgi:hypothetical protein
MRRTTTGLVCALSMAMLLLLGGTAAHAITVDGTVCLAATSALTGITHTETLNFLTGPGGVWLVFGRGCYVIPPDGGPGGADCVPVYGGAIFFEDRAELALTGIENQVDFGHSILTVSNTHIWLTDLANLTGTWAAESITYIEGGAQDVQQFDRGTVGPVVCAL